MLTEVKQNDYANMTMFIGMWVYKVTCASTHWPSYKRGQQAIREETVRKTAKGVGNFMCYL